MRGRRHEAAIFRLEQPPVDGIAEEIGALLGSMLIETIDHADELTFVVARDDLANAMVALRDMAHYQQLMEIAGVDYPERPDRFEVAYHLLSVTRNHRVRVKVSTDEDTPVPTVTHLWPVAGWLAHKAGTLFIRRGAGDSSQVGQQLTRHLQQGHHLLIFPEGTTTDGLALRTFHGRLLSSAIDSGVPLQPVAIRYWRDGAVDLQAAFIGDDDLLSHLRRLLSAPAAEVEIHLLPLLLPLPEENRNQLARRAQHCVADCLERLRAPSAEPQVSALTS